MKMLFVARAMDQMAGGVERMIVMVMDAMVARGHEVALFSWDHADAKSFYPMASKIDWYRLDMGDPAKKAGGRLIAARAKVVRRLVRNIAPNVIICFQGGPFISMALYCAGFGIPLVAAERTAPTLYDHVRNAWMRSVEHQAFRFAARITIQFERYRALYPAHLHHLMVTIPNPVMPAKIQAVPDAAGPERRFCLLSVGRLSYQKNFGVLLSTFAELAPRFPDWDLQWWGRARTTNCWKRSWRAFRPSTAVFQCRARQLTSRPNMQRPISSAFPHAGRVFPMHSARLSLMGSPQSASKGAPGFRT